MQARPTLSISFCLPRIGIGGGVLFEDRGGDAGDGRVVVVVDVAKSLPDAAGRLREEKRGGRRLPRGRDGGAAEGCLEFRVATTQHADGSVKFHGRLGDRLLDELPIENRLAVADQSPHDRQAEPVDQTADDPSVRDQLGRLHGHAGPSQETGQRPAVKRPSTARCRQG